MNYQFEDAGFKCFKKVNQESLLIHECHKLTHVTALGAQSQHVHFAGRQRLAPPLLLLESFKILHELMCLVIGIVKATKSLKLCLKSAPVLFSVLLGQGGPGPQNRHPLGFSLLPGRKCLSGWRENPAGFQS